MNIRKQAIRDAREMAEAYMAYGEGAGTRRKLISATVETKANTIPAYAEAYAEAYLNTDWAKLAKQAKYNDRNRRINRYVGKNARAIVNGRPENISLGVYAGAATLYFLYGTEKGAQVRRTINARRRETIESGKEFVRDLIASREGRS